MRLTILILALSLHFSLSGQIDIINTSLTKPELNYLYLGVDNSVKIKGGLHKREYVLKCSATVVIEAHKHNRFVLKPKQGSKVDTLTVLLGDSIVFTKVFQVKSIDAPKVTLCGKTEGSITLVELLKHPRLVCAKNDYYKEAKYTIKSFEFSGTAANGIIAPLVSKGPYFDSKVINALKTKQEIGKRIYIENIKVITPSGPRTLFQSIVLTIQ